IQQIEEEYQKRKAEAERVAVQLTDKAEEEMVAKRDATLKKTREDAERIITEATGTKDKIREDVRKEEQQNMINYCEEILSTTFKDVIKQKMNELLIEDFLKEFEEIDMSHVPSDVPEIELVLSGEISGDAKTMITDIMNKKLGKKPNLKETIDHTILAGIVIKFGSLVLDGSLSGKLKEAVTLKLQKLEEAG
ncbi:F0F1 ATP synthase subunit delta, partial [Candidatus Omnitrophota bacterium]